jgi:coatomer subunit beta'
VIRTESTTLQCFDDLFLQVLVKSFEAADVPARCAKFVPRKQWVVIGSDDMFMRVFNYNTMDREKMWEAHADYIRSIAVHPSLPYILSCSDDMLIKLWDWDTGFQCVRVFEGHIHYVMQVCFKLNILNPEVGFLESIDEE